MPLTSSQGYAYGITGATKVAIKHTRSSKPGDSNSQLDASTLEIATGGDRVYEAGLEDPGQTNSEDGIVTTATVDFLGDGPALGDVIEFDGVDCKCIEVEVSNDAGELVKGTAMFTSDYPAGS